MSPSIAFLLASVLALVLGFIIVSDALPLRFIHNIVKKFKTAYKAEDVVQVKAKTLSLKWTLGATVTSLDFIFPPEIPGKVRLTDTRTPFSPIKSGYSEKEVEAILLWLSLIPETVDGYQHVVHLREMLAAKHSKQ